MAAQCEEKASVVLDHQEFRRRIAGLVTSKRDCGSAEYQAYAVRCGVVLARNYNRDLLDPMALWGRIETAMLSGIEKRSDDPASVISAMLAHVQASGDSVSRDADFSALLRDLSGKDDAWMDGFCSYIRRSIYAILVYARDGWEQAKAESKKKRTGRKTVEDEAAAREAGENETSLFPEEDVANALQARKEMRGDI